MKRLTVALGIVVLGTMNFCPNTLAENFRNSNELLVSQVKTELKPQLQFPKIQPLSKPNYNSGSSNVNQVDALLNEAYESLNKGDFNKTIESCNSVLKIDRNNYEAYLFRGLAYTYLEKYQPAISDFEQAIRLEPNFAFSYFGRGFARVQLQQYQQSIADFEQTIKMEPEFAHAYFWRGVAKANLAQKEEAKSDLQKAAALYEKQGKPEAAEQALNLLKQIYKA